MSEQYITGAVFLETLAFLQLFVFNNVFGILIYLALHFIVSFLISLLLSAFFSLKLRKQKKNLIISLTTIIFLTSVIGVLFSILLLIYIFVRKKHNIDIYLKFTGLDEYSENLPLTKRTIGESIFSQLKKEVPSEVKLKVLSLLKSMKISGAGKILKEVLSDNNDEVRLLAFSLISKEENEIVNKIQKLKAKLEHEKNNSTKSEILRSIGILYWDMIFLEIIDDELKEFYIEEAKKHLKESLEIKENFDTYFYMGRIALKENNLHLAEEYFNKALNLKKDNKVLPYIAEIYFHKKEYKKVMQIFSDINFYSVHPNFYPNYKVWKKDE